MLALSVLLVIGTVVAVSLARVSAGVLSRRSGEWAYTTAARSFSGSPVVAIDLGSFMLLRLDLAPRRRLWLALQRRSFEREWHALRCALYSAPSSRVLPASAPAPPLE